MTTPQDHKQPKDKPRTVTIDGVAITIDPKTFDDLDMVEYLYDLQHADDNAEGSFSIVPLLKKLTGTAYPKVKTALRDPETGRVSMEAVGRFVTRLMKEAAPNS